MLAGRVPRPGESVRGALRSRWLRSEGAKNREERGLLEQPGDNSSPSSTRAPGRKQDRRVGKNGFTLLCKTGGLWTQQEQSGQHAALLSVPSLPPFQVVLKYLGK